MTKLRQYQVEGVRGIYQFRGRCLLADEMGLGKTIMCLDWVRRLPQCRPVVIVCPASVKYVWQSEAALHFNIRTEVLEGEANKRSVMPGNIVIVNYDILPSWLKVLRKAKPQIIIIDEIHYIKSSKARRTKAVRKLCRKARSVVGTSGTPMTNRPIELWSVLQAINPDIFPSKTDFAWRYCKPRYTPWGWVYDGSSNSKELREILLETCMIRRLKKDVLGELPPVTQNLVPFHLHDSDQEDYESAQKNFIEWLRKLSPAKAKRAAKSQGLTKVGYLLRLVAKLKYPHTEQWVADFLADNPNEKIVALTMHRAVIDRLRERFRGKILFIDGRVKGKKRHDTVRAFQNNRQYQMLVGNWKAAGIGITLTAAAHIAGLDFPWTPADLCQGRDRIHRFGQKRKCFMHHLITKHTIEEKQVRLLHKKSKVLDAILDGTAADADLNVFGELVESLKTSLPPGSGPR